jgi:hypothetical protein
VCEHKCSKATAERINSASATYQQQLIDTPPFILSMPNGRAVRGQDGVANKLFLTFLFSNKETGVQFLKDVGILHSKVARNTWLSYVLMR